VVNHQQEEPDADRGFQTDTVEVEEPIIDLDAISAQSLRLVRSILTLIALVCISARRWRARSKAMRRR
jgi:small-conductance mechanosensitive channel